MDFTYEYTYQDLGWCSESECGFSYEYTYQDSEYIIRTMNNKHVQCTFSL